MTRILGATLVAMLISVLCGPYVIKWLRARGVGQNIREYAPERHNKKQGTPTMGGVLILTSALFTYLVFGRRSVEAVSVLILTIGCGLIGLADDVMKKRRNRSLGLTARRKLLLQLPLAVIISLVLIRWGGVDTRLGVPFAEGTINIGWLYYPFAYLLIAGFSNAVNLTDGLDGLAAGAVSVSLFAFAGIAFLLGEIDTAILAGCLTGACMGFMWFNCFPAEVFMGDTGSLALGAAVAGMAMVTQTEILSILIGGLFVVEAVSVALQVIAFRLSKKRIFLMTPIHHHFELKNWSETKIIVRFWMIAGLLAAIGFTLYYLSIKQLGIPIKR